MTTSSETAVPHGAAVGLVGCSRLKLPHAAPARRLYASPLFRLAARFCDSTCERWFVLSAKHGLLDPDEVVEPYDLTLKRLGRREREAWAGRVVRQLSERGLLDTGHRLVLLAGADYAGPLARRIRIEQPLKGLPIGLRLAWYRRRLTPAGHSLLPQHQPHSERTDMARKKKLAAPTPSAAEVERACRAAPAMIEDLIARLQALAAAAPGAHVILSKDSEGNDFSPLFRLTLGVYRPHDSWRGEVDDLPEGQGAGANAVVLWPMS